ncbi:MAG: hypothetical protein ABJB47_01620 [Actinomycetota bacterium]
MLTSEYLAVKRLVILFIVLGVALAVVTALFVPKKFSAHAQMGLVQTTSFRPGPGGGPASGRLPVIRRAPTWPPRGREHGHFPEETYPGAICRLIIAPGHLAAAPGTRWDRPDRSQDPR